MKKAVITEARKVSIIEVPEPAIKNDYDVKIKVAYAGICPDEMSFYRRSNDMLAWGPVLFPAASHEMSGTIVDLGSGAVNDGFAINDRVSGYAWHQCGHCYYCRSGKENHCLNLQAVQSTLSEYIVWNSRQLIKLPDSVSFKEGCLTDPIGFSLHGIKRANVKIGDKVMIIGGTIPGLILLQLAKMCGSTCITVVEPNASNRIIAESLGAEFVLNPDSDNISAHALTITNQLGYDVIFEASGNIAMLSSASKVVARQGIIAYSSIYGLNSIPPVNLAELFIKEATLLPFHMAPYMLPTVQSIICSLKLSPIISKVYDFEDVSLAYEATDLGTYPHVVVRVNGED